MPAVSTPVFREIRETLTDLLAYEDSGDRPLELLARRAHNLLEKTAPRKAPKKTLPGPSRAKERAARKVKRKEKTKAVREAVAARAHCLCEGCGAFGHPWIRLEMDHFFGGASRRLRESVETCWMLCPQCHQNKTANRPSAKYWRDLFREHLTTMDYPIPRDL